MRAIIRRSESTSQAMIYAKRSHNRAKTKWLIIDSNLIERWGATRRCRKKLFSWNLFRYALGT